MCWPAVASSPACRWVPPVRGWKHSRLCVTRAGPRASNGRPCPRLLVPPGPPPGFIWHGTSDRSVNAANPDALEAQWVGVLRLTPTSWSLGASARIPAACGAIGWAANDYGANPSGGRATAPPSRPMPAGDSPSGSARPLHARFGDRLDLAAGPRSGAGSPAPLSITSARSASHSHGRPPTWPSCHRGRKTDCRPPAPGRRSSASPPDGCRRKPAGRAPCCTPPCW